MLDARTLENIPEHGQRREALYWRHVKFRSAEVSDSRDTDPYWKEVHAERGCYRHACFADCFKRAASAFGWSRDSSHDAQ